MILKLLLSLDERLSALRHRLLERRILRSTLFFAYALELSPAARTFDSNLLRSADTGNHVFALSVDEVFTIEDVLTGSSVASESHTGS